MEVIIQFQIIIILRTAGVYDIVDKSRLPGASEESKKKWSEDDLKAQPHIADFENLSHELKSCGDEMSENMLVNKILMTLPESFEHFHSAWDTSPEKTLNSMISRLIAEEKRIRNRDKRDEGMVEAFSAEKSN
ncbi:hypothetical protein JTB14_006417 [Gonioctena quinquepunctata]|nr:hypothetical protein JTB14_006417 [Gonioctena quinquepunctata]